MTTYNASVSIEVSVPVEAASPKEAADKVMATVGRADIVRAVAQGNFGIDHAFELFVGMGEKVWPVADAAPALSPMRSTP